MPSDENFRRYIEAGAVLGRVTRARAEELVRDLLGASDRPRTEAQQWVDELAARGRKMTEELVELVRSEVANQLASLGFEPEELAKQVSEAVRRSLEAGKRATGAGTSAGTKAAPKKAGKKAGIAKTAAPKKAGTAKAAAPKKAAAKKAGTAKAAAKKAAPKKAAKKAGTATAASQASAAPDNPTGEQPPSPPGSAGGA